MKKILYVLLSAMVFIGIGSCTKKDVNELTEFDINYSNELTIPSTSFTTVTVPVDLNTPEFATNINSNASSNKTTSDLISEIKLTKFNLANSSGNLDFLKSVSIYIKATGLSETLIATKSNIPAGTTSISADLKDVNIKDYITKEKISFKVSFLFQTSSSSSMNLKMDETVHVKATILK